MVMAKNLIPNSKTDLGWDAQDADFTTWCNNVKDDCACHQIVSKTKAGESKLVKCLAVVPKLEGFKQRVRTRIVVGSKFHSKVLEALVVVTLKKRSETSEKLELMRTCKPK